MKYKFDLENHVHSLDGRPLTGTSSVINVLSKPLTYWASGLACECFGWLNPKKHDNDAVQNALREGFDMVKALDLDSYAKLLDRAYRAHATKLKEAAGTGTDLHAELERFVKSRMGKNKETVFDPKIQPFIDWSDANVKRFIASEAHCYSERLWCGGIVDAIAELKDGTYAVIDFKSSKEAYVSQFIQAAGYAIQIMENGLFSENGKHSKNLDAPIVSLIVIPFGAEKVEPSIRNNVDEYSKGFEQAVGLYRLLGMEKQ